MVRIEPSAMLLLPKQETPQADPAKADPTGLHAALCPGVIGDRRFLVDLARSFDALP